MTAIEFIIKNNLKRKEYYYLLKNRSCRPSKRTFLKAMEIWFKMKEEQNDK